MDDDLRYDSVPILTHLWQENWNGKDETRRRNGKRSLKWIKYRQRNVETGLDPTQLVYWLGKSRPLKVYCITELE